MGSSRSRLSRPIMLLRIFGVITCYCLIHISGKSISNGDELLLEGVRQAVEEGVDKTMVVTKSVIVSSLDALEEDMREKDYKAKDKMKGFDVDQAKKRIGGILQKQQKSQEGKIMKAVTAAVCTRDGDAQTEHVKEAVNAFEDLLDDIRDATLNVAAGKFLDSLESFVNTEGTGINFGEEEMKEVALIDEDGDVTVADFEDEIKELVSQLQGKVKNCGNNDSDREALVDVSKHTNAMVDAVYEKLQEVRKLANA